MENASKALIIAGAILISIILISLGVIIVNMGKKATDNINMDDMEIQAFNSKFTQYEGTKQSAINVKSLIEAVESSNSANDAKDENDVKFIKLEGVTERGSVSSSKRYTVVCAKEDRGQGLVTKITITENK